VETLFPSVRINLTAMTRLHQQA